MLCAFPDKLCLVKKKILLTETSFLFTIPVFELNFSSGDYLLERANSIQPKMLNENLYLISAVPEAEKIWKN